MEECVKGIVYSTHNIRHQIYKYEIDIKDTVKNTYDSQSYNKNIKILETLEKNSHDEQYKSYLQNTKNQLWQHLIYIQNAQIFFTLC